MHKLFHVAVGALALGLFTPMAQLQAATYIFQPINVINNPFNIPIFNLTSSTFPEISISIQDSAVYSGFFSIYYTGSTDSFTGDLTSFISFSIGSIVSIYPNTGDIGNFRANLLFNTDGSVSAGALSYSSSRFEVDLAGSADLFQGAFAPSGTAGQGFVDGTLMAIPEPASVLLLIGSVFGLGLTRRRAR